jgi:phytoene synthase
MHDLNPDITLALSYVPAARRPALEALFRLDVALGAVLAGGREPMISRIKLAWWREALEKLDRDKAPAEPVLEAAAAHLLPVGVSGADLAAMEEGWTALLSDAPLAAEELRTYAAGRGGLLFAYAARLLGADGEAGGEAWALVDLARHSGNEFDRDAALAAARALPPPPRLPSRLRPLGMLGALARRDAEPDRHHWEPQGAPKRMLRMLLHRLTGL